MENLAGMIPLALHVSLHFYR